MRVFEAVVTDIRLEKQVGLVGTWLMSLSRTEFEVGATGTLEAMTRSGTRLEIPVTDVTEDENGIRWHTVEKPLAAGTDVRGVVKES
jgi:hypothetical protein